MALTTLTTLEQKLQLNDVAAVSITTIEQDEEGNWIREFRFTGTPLEGQTIAPVSLVVRAVAATKDQLEITTPELEF